MIVRYASEKDIPQIVELLKLSLGEGLMPKSEAYWRWKHVDNPFGPSPVLLAEADGKIVGVRAFMRWEWTDGKTILKSVRAVDTATHPDYQGKGIFKKLTLQLVDDCRKEGVHFVFNTPNTQSRPGYLKMGWIDAGKLPIRIVLGNPLKRLIRKFGVAHMEEAVSVANFLKKNATNPRIENHEQQVKNQFLTNYSRQYLSWRYSQVPVAAYFVVLGESDHEFLIYRIKKNKWATELRVTDIFSTDQDATGNLLTLLYKQANRMSADYITFSGTKDVMRHGLKLQRGPMVTIRDIQYSQFNQLRSFKNWHPSLGDLELF